MPKAIQYFLRDREVPVESWGLEASYIIGNENDDDTTMYGNMLAHDGKSVDNNVGNTKNMNNYKISYERSMERTGNSSK